MKKIFLMILMCFSMVTLNGCFNEGDNNGNNVEQSPVELLNSSEKSIYDVLVSNLRTFIDPNTVEVSSVTQSFFDDSAFKIKVKASNSYGTLIYKDYFVTVQEKTISNLDFSNYSTAYIVSSTGEVTNPSNTRTMDNNLFLDIDSIITPNYSLVELLALPASQYFVYNLFIYQKGYDTPTDIKVSNINNALNEYKSTNL